VSEYWSKREGEGGHRGKGGREGGKEGRRAGMYLALCIAEAISEGLFGEACENDRVDRTNAKERK